MTITYTADRVTLQDVRDIYATRGFMAAEATIRQCFKVPCQEERDLMNELWRLYGEAGTAYCKEVIREHQEWLRAIKAGAV